MICSAQAHSRCPTLAAVHKTLKDSAESPVDLRWHRPEWNEESVGSTCAEQMHRESFFEVYRPHFEKYMSANAPDRDKIS